MSVIEEFQTIFSAEKEKFFKDYFTFLRFPSVSTDSAYKEHILACASWVEEYLSEAGLKVERWEGAGHPTVFAQWDGAGSEKPTILIYGHYDVQPVDPLELWKSPPFDPQVRDGEVYARGAQDDKGQIFYAMAAIRALLKKHGTLPVNLKILIEGEEESSSKTLSAILPERTAQLRADHLIVIDVGFTDIRKPAVVLGVRGMCAMELILTGSNVDLHSGTNGGVVYNPNRALVELLSKCVDSEGKVTVPGFYDSVKELTPAERKPLSLDFDPAWYEALFAAKSTGGEKKYSVPERAWLRPTFEINGIAGGYFGEGFKTVIPSKAIAKISCRLVPDQEPEETFHLVEKFLRKNAPAEMSVEIRYMGGGSAARSNSESKVVRAAARAFTDVNGLPCAFTMEGGSLPIVSSLVKASRAELVMIGYALPGDLMHAPNEHFGLDRMEKGFLTVCRLLRILGE